MYLYIYPSILAFYFLTQYIYFSLKMVNMFEPQLELHQFVLYRTTFGFL